MQIKDDDGVGFGIEEIIETNGYLEGKYTTSIVNRYERDPNARRACIKIYGTKCQICGFDFETKYGELGKDYIEAHHTIPISEMEKGHKTTIDEIVLVCSNCHKMLHRKRPLLNADEIKKVLK